MVEETLGYVAVGRHGELGIVVDVVKTEDGRATALVVRGGISSALTYYVPTSYVRRVSANTTRVFVDLDHTDFVPVLRGDGTIELRGPAG